MRASMIGRWLGRAAMAAALAIGVLAVSGTAASANQQDTVVSTSGVDWN